MKKVLQTLILLLISLSSYQTFATHLMGGDITYELVTAPNIYKVHLTLYRDCSGIVPVTNPVIQVKQYGTQNIYTQIVLNMSAAPLNVTNLCPSAISSST